MKWFIHLLRRPAAIGVLLAATILSSDRASANDYPMKPVFLVVPFAPGGATDILARYVAEKLGSAIGQRVIVDNRGGGGALIGTDYVARAPKDGYTLLLHTPTLAILGATKKGGLDVKKDLVPVSLLASGPFVLVVNNSLPVKNAVELIAHAKKNPGKLNFGSPGPGTSIHLAGELFKAMAGLDVVHVPYKGNAPALLGLMSNDIQFMFDTLATAKPLADDSKVRLIGVGAKQRSIYLPEAPTIDETGLPGFDAGVWMGVLAPAGTPRDIVSKLSVTLKGILVNEDVKKQLANQGLEPKGLSADEFGTMLNSEIDRYADLIQRQNLQIE